MSIPSRVEAAQLLVQLRPSDRLLAHSTAVAEIAAFLGAALARRGLTIDVTLTETAALLHDVDKALPADDPLRELGHGAAGAEWLRQHGHAELAAAVANHPVLAIAAPPTDADWARAAGLEGRVVAYADKRALQDLVDLEQRFARWEARYPGSAPLLVARRRAEQLERELCAAAGIAPGDVARLPWVTAALRRAA